MVTKSFSKEGHEIDDLTIARLFFHDGSEKMIWQLPLCFLAMVLR
jgi:hypothetical protein